MKDLIILFDITFSLKLLIIKAYEQYDTLRNTYARNHKEKTSEEV